jgi:hypothetical protein
MRGNWIEMTATQTAANANPTALSAVAGLPTYADVFGATGTRLVEYEMDDGAGRFECGYGQIDLATMSLSRDYPIATFDAGATPKYVSGNVPRLTNFGAAVTVRCSPLASAVGGGELHPSASFFSGIGNGYFNNQGDGFYSTGFQGWRNFFAFLWTGSRPIKSISINVRSAATAGILRVGLMEIVAPTSFRLIQEFTINSQFNAALSGIQTINNFPPLAVPQGPYVLQAVTSGISGSFAVSACSGHMSDRMSVFGKQSDGRPINCIIDSAGASTLAASLTGTGNGGAANYANPPQFLFGT